MENATLNDEYGYVKDSKVFLKGYLDFPDRQIGEVKRTEQEAIDYFKNRFNIVLNKVEQLEQEIDEALNKGSYLTSSPRHPVTPSHQVSQPIPQHRQHQSGCA